MEAILETKNFLLVELKKQNPKQYNMNIYSVEQNNLRKMLETFMHLNNVSNIKEKRNSSFYKLETMPQDYYIKQDSTKAGIVVYNSKGIMYII